jgi:CSLREA domain-containing protein
MKALARFLYVLSLTAFCVACGGGGGGAAPPLQPPVVNASPGGIWTGIDSDGDLIAAFVTETGRFHVIDEFLNQGSGILSVSNGNDVTANFQLVTEFGFTFPDGTTLADCTLSGTVTERQTMSVTVNCTTTAGLQDQITVTLNYDAIYERDSSLATIAGVYDDGSGIVTDIASDGMIFEQDPVTGCVTIGQVRVINNGTFNLYDVEFGFSNCIGPFAFLNGSSFVGIGTLDNTVTPEVLIVFATGDVAGTLVSLVSVAERLLPGSIIIVNTTDDELNADGDCSLREAIRAANTDSMVDTCTGGSGRDDIVFDAIVVPGTFALSISGIGEDAALTGDLDITDDLTIIGGGAGNTIIDGLGIDRVFDVIGAIPFNLYGLTVQGGAAGVGAGIFNDDGRVTISDSVVRDNVSSRNGGGIRNLSRGLLNIFHSSITDNTSGTAGFGGGGGIDNDGTLIITNSTIAGNSSQLEGGGIFAGGIAIIINTTFANNNSRADVGGGFASVGGSFTIINSTISGNTASSGGGGIGHRSGTLELQNTIVAGNNNPNSPDCSGSITSLGNNLIGDITGCGIVLLPTSDLTGDPGLSGFVNDGTPGEGYFPLLPSSQAIDTGENSACPDTDQLGNPRPVDGDGNGTAICDIGALEF